MTLQRDQPVIGGAVTLCGALTAPATASATDPPVDVVGNATYVDGLGRPYGGCGLAQADLNSPDFVALNVNHTPGDYRTGGAWHPATMDGDMGQAYAVSPAATGRTGFRIRVHDVPDALVVGGRAYDFSLPAACSPQCAAPYTRVGYSTSA